MNVRRCLLSSVLTVALCFTSVVQGDSGADALIDSLGLSDSSSNTSAKTGKGIQLRDPFTIQFFSQWQTQKALPFELNAWCMKVLKGEFVDAAHLWTVVQKQLSGDFEYAAKGAYLYLLWKVELPQTFFNSWLSQLQDPKFAQSRVNMALDQTIAANFDKWFYTNGISVSPEQTKIIDSLPLERGPHVTTLKAWVNLRKGLAGKDILERLHPGHPLKIPLAQTVSLAWARAGDMKAAASILKKQTEPAVEESGDPEALSTHYLHVARLLYQAGALDAAESFYTKVPSGSKNFLKAREELVWVWLRQGKLSELRGELATLSSDVFKDQFAPEVYIVRAVSNLKLCFYDKVDQDIQDFVSANKIWAKRIQEALAPETPLQPEPRDRFSQLAALSVAQLEKEQKRLEQLAKESVGASLPAVGPQKHWRESETRLIRNIEQARKRLAQEYRRQWLTREALLKESIQKMRFVKIELLSQVRELSRRSGDPSALKDTPERLTEERRAKLQTDDGDIVFPFDGVAWPDELFKIRAVAQAQCLEGIRQ